MPSNQLIIARLIPKGKQKIQSKPMAGIITLKTRGKAKERPKDGPPARTKEGRYQLSPSQQGTHQLRLMFSSCLRQGAHISGISCSTGFTSRYLPLAPTN